MSEKIDWSKAPDSAMVLLKHTRDGAYAVAESFSDDARTWHFPETNYTFRLMPSMWYVVSHRPTTPSWSGGCLPPVGVVCRKCYNSPGEYYSVKVLAHDSHDGEVVIYRWIDGPLEGDLGQSTMHLNMASGSNAHWSFRPIRTPEQIAADEREAAIEDMLKGVPIVVQVYGAHEIASRIYDKGYRKP